MPQPHPVPVPPPPWTIRAATVNDAEAIEAVRIATWKACYRGLLPDTYLDDLKVESRRVDRIRRGIERADGAVRVVAVAESQVIGMGMAGSPEEAESDPQIGELYVLYVLPGWQGQGVGRALWQRISAGLSARGYRTAILWTLRDRSPTRRFYEANGWTFDGADDEWGEGFSIPIVRYSCNLGRSA